MTRLLLDTHVLLWTLGDPGALGDEARAAIVDSDNDVLVSAASAWEIGIKAGLGKLRAPDDLEAQIARRRFDTLPVTVRHGHAVRDLPPVHRDPFDRLLVAQARLERLVLVTRNAVLGRYDVPVLPA